MTPDKIYISPNIENRSWLIGKANTVSIEYIRKDALLEWAEEMKDAWECYADTSYYQEFIDKINSI